MALVMDLVGVRGAYTEAPLTREVAVCTEVVHGEGEGHMVCSPFS